MACTNVTVTQLPLDGDIFRTEDVGEEIGEGWDTQVRYRSTDSDVVEDYCEKLQEGVVFPPVDVFYDGTYYWLADGWHRWDAAVAAGLKTIEAIVHHGGKRDAILFAVGANRAHGLHRTSEDKRKAVDLLLKDEEWVTWSDSVIAEKCGVSQPFVSKLRNELITVIGSAAAKAKDKPRKGKDGKSRKARNAPLKIHDTEPGEVEHGEDGPESGEHVPELTKLSNKELKERSAITQALCDAQNCINKFAMFRHGGQKEYAMESLGRLVSNIDFTFIDVRAYLDSTTIVERDPS
jgi:hypothetical protein